MEEKFSRLGSSYIKTNFEIIYSAVVDELRNQRGN